MDIRIANLNIGKIGAIIRLKRLKKLERIQMSGINEYWDMSGETTQRLYLMLGLLDELKAGEIVINKVKDEIIKRKTVISDQLSVNGDRLSVNSRTFSAGN